LGRAIKESPGYGLFVFAHPFGEYPDALLTTNAAVELTVKNNMILRHSLETPCYGC
jgi:hypothetical protein